VILAAGLLVLVGLGLFVGGLLTGETTLYWGCVAVCVVAAVLLFVARRQLGRAPGGAPTPPAGAKQGGTSPPAAEATAPPPGAGTSAEPASAGAHGRPGELGDPPVEEVEVTDLLMVVDLKDEVLVVDEHPRYHVAGCSYLAGRTTIPLPLDEARTDGFTPCAVCAPDRTLAQRARERR
jgi:hypothetical protein